MNQAVLDRMRKVQGQGVLDVLTARAASTAGMLDVVLELSGPLSFAAAVALIGRLEDEIARLGGDPAALMDRIGAAAGADLAA